MSESESTKINDAESRVKKYRDSVATKRGFDTYHGTQHNLMHDLGILADAYMDSELAALRKRVAELEKALKLALRQWNAHYDMHVHECDPEQDLKSAKHMEGESYRWCASQLK
jgi:hypothetical protein